MSKIIPSISKKPKAFLIIIHNIIYMHISFGPRCLRAFNVFKIFIKLKYRNIVITEVYCPSDTDEIKRKLLL